MKRHGRRVVSLVTGMPRVFVRKLGDVICQEGKLHREVFSEINFAGFRGAQDFFLVSLGNNLSVRDDNSPVCNFECIADVVVCY